LSAIHAAVLAPWPLNRSLRLFYGVFWGAGRAARESLRIDVKTGGGAGHMGQRSVSYLNHQGEDDDYRQHLASIVENSDDAIISKDVNGVITSWNRGAEMLYGYTAAEAIGQPVTMLIPEERLDEEPDILAKIRRGERIDHYETVRRRKDGTTVHISLTVSPIKNAQGTVVGASKIARDITERRRAQELDAIIHGEMQHRVKNLLMVIEGLARSSRPRNVPAVDNFLDAFMPRLQALLSVGEVVLESSGRRADLQRVAAIALAPFMVPATAPRIVIDGPPVDVTESTAGALALAFHELATNAIKYGALRTDKGTISLTWTRQPLGGETRVVIEWKEHAPAPIAKSHARGFGSRVIGAAVSGEREGRSDLIFEEDGLRCRLEFLQT
jgi:PAS domain S-box-containing protein